jgi:dynein heavy chain
MKIVNVLLMAAIAPPGGGRNNITTRFSRHFNILSIESFDDGLMRSIFSPVMQWYFQSSFFPDAYSKYITVFVLT